MDLMLRANRKCSVVVVVVGCLRACEMERSGVHVRFACLCVYAGGGRGH